MAKATCSVDGCDRPYLARQMCGMHYNRWRKSIPGARVPEDLRRKPSTPCSVEGCEAIAQARGWCHLHYRRWWLPQYREVNREAVRGWKLGRYGINRAEYDALFEAQGGICPICLRVPDPPAVDHDHVTGRVRGVLCRPCNLGIGQLGDDPERLTRAARYLA